jgi:hypothetical protein
MCTLQKLLGTDLDLLCAQAKLVAVLGGFILTESVSYVDTISN